MLNPRHGEINLHGKNSKTTTKENWGEFFSCCSQTPFLFHGTLKENVSILNPKATDTEIRRTLEMFNFNLENGNETIDLDRYISQDGKNMSAGQRQKTALARTILKRAKVYIFDEAISNVDRESKLKILNYLKASLKDRIVIWISHERWGQYMDFSFVLEGGKVKSREELSELRGLNAKIAY